jgi:hypothetical protein
MQKRVVLKIVIPALVVLAAIGITVQHYRAPAALPNDSVDRFELLQAVPATKGQRYAAVYRYYHANSSSTVGAVWVLNGTPPSPGSTEAVAGDPALVFTGNADALRAEWPADSERPNVEVDRLSDVKKGPTAIEDCYFADARSTNLVCYDDKIVNLH